MKTINSLNNEYIKTLQKLHQKKSIISTGKYLVEGKNIIDEAINANVIETILVTNEKSFSNFKNRILVTEEIIKKLSSNESNFGAIAVCQIVETKFDLDSFDKIVVLDQINNPGNFGNIIRTAKAFGYQAVITMGPSVYKYNSKVISGTQGAIFNFPVIQIDNYIELKQESYLFTLENDSTSIDDVKISDSKYALVFGNESQGLSQELIIKLKGKKIYIPISGVESLSVASAASIAMYKFK